MSRESEVEVYKYLKEQKMSPQIRRMVELLTFTRESCLNKLEVGDSPEIRGRSKFCKELIKLLSD